MSNNTEPTTIENTTPEGTATTEQSAQTAPAPVLEGTALLEAIQRQVEFYFSEQNLAKDAYLVSQMDSNYYVLLSTIASFSKMRALTEDSNLIIESLKKSTVVQLSEDNARIKPRESERKTLIIYNLPAGTTIEEIETLIKEGGFAATVSPSVMNTFYATFATPEDTTEAHFYLRNQKIHDQDVRVRVKSETTVRSLYLVDTPMHVPVMFPPYSGGVPRGNWNPMNMVPYWDPNNPNAVDYANRPYDNKDSYRGNRNFRKSRKEQRKGQYAGVEGKRRPSNRKKGSRDNKKQTNAALQLGPAHFPPLPSARKEVKSGYTESFTQYSSEDLVSIVQSLGDVPKPSDLSDKESFIAAAQNTKLEVLQILSDAEELQEGVPPPSAVSLSEIIKSSKGKQSSDSKPRANNTVPAAEKEKTKQPQEKPAAQPPKNEKAAAKPPAASGTAKPAAEQRGNKDQSGKRTWSQVVTKFEKDTEKENNVPGGSPKATTGEVSSAKDASQKPAASATPVTPAVDVSEKQPEQPANN